MLYNKRYTLTLLEIAVLTSAACGSPIRMPEYPAQQEAVARFLKLGLIHPAPRERSLCGYRCTDLGEELVRRLTSTPIPKAKPLQPAERGALLPAQNVSMMSGHPKAPMGYHLCRATHKQWLAIRSVSLPNRCGVRSVAAFARARRIANTFVPVK